MKPQVPFVVVSILVIGVFSFCFLGRGGDDGGAVTASGTVEAVEVRVAPQVGGRILDLDLEEGRYVTRGQTVCHLSADGLDSDVRAKEAVLGRERERLRELANGARPEEIKESLSALRAKEAELAQAERDAERYGLLYSEDLVSRREAELYRQNAAVLRESAEAARQQYLLLTRGTREEALAQQADAVRQAEAALDAARLLLSYKRVESPVSGIILSKNFETGEVVSQGSPLLTVAAEGDRWVGVYVPASLIDRIRVGQSADVYVGSPPDKPFPGRVSHVASEAEFNPRMSLSQRERENQVFRVKVVVSDDSGRVKPGMPADVVFGGE